MPNRAVIFVQKGAPAEKQTTACLKYVLNQRWSMLAIVPYWQPGDAVKLVRAGRVDTVVAAFDSKAVQQLAVEIDGDAEVMVIHPEPKLVEPPKQRIGTISDLILRWFRRGKTVQQIAIEEDWNTSDVRAILRRHGEDPDGTA